MFDFKLSKTVNKPTRGTNIVALVLTTVPETLGPLLYTDSFSEHIPLQRTIHKPVTRIDVINNKVVRNYIKDGFESRNVGLVAVFFQSLLRTF